MAYNKPGVEIVQEAKNLTPTLITPDLEACVIGNGYHWQDISLEESIVTSTTYNGQSTVFALSGINSVFYNVSDLEELVLVDLVTISGTGIGEVIHLTYSDDFTVTNNQVTISANTDYQNNVYQIRAGYLAKKTSSDYGFKVISSLSDVEETIGKAVSWNPLAFGARLAILNSARSINVLNVSGVSALDLENAIDGELSAREVYALTIMSHNVDIGVFKTHVDTYSLPENKKERIAILNRDLSSLWDGDAFSSSNTEKTNTATAVRDANISYLDRRIVITHPDVAYVLENRHISTISPTWIANSFSATSSGFASYGLKAKLAYDAFVNSKKYKAGTEITAEIWEELRDYSYADNSGNVTVLVPVPGYYYPAMVVGQVIGEQPEQPLTNLPTVGLKETKGSSDYFNEAQLNIIAEGGTYIMNQVNSSSPIVSRHQLTTDMTQVTKRELSIVKTLDFVAKFLRKSMQSYIGRYTVSPAFLKLFNSILISLAIYLKRVGRVNDMKIVSVTVDENNPDTVRATVDIRVKYPVNYIKITLLF